MEAVSISGTNAARVPGQPEQPLGTASAMPGQPEAAAQTRSFHPAWTPATSARAAHKQPRPALLRTPRQPIPGRPNAIFAGVCSGLSVHMSVSVTVVRIGVLALSLLSGIGILLYLWLWAFVPVVSTSRAYSQTRLVKAQQLSGRKPLSPTQKIVFSALSLAGMSFILAVGIMTQPDLGYTRLAVVAIIGGVLIIWTQSNRITQWQNPRVIGLAAAGIGVLFWGIVMLVANESGGTKQFLTAFTAGITFIAVLALAFFPAWNNLIKDLTATRIESARETERADIAAHLHDSVLQTLTLIKNHADDPATVRSLALTQERELRAWLYTGRNTVSQSFTELLKTTVSEVETTYGQEIEVVCVADCVPGPAEQAACAAASEACVNAVRHGHPPLQVYSEVGESRVEIYIKDRGPGFDPHQIAPDRHGVRDSIIGRVERVGGTVNIRRLQPGTEVTITVPRTPKEIG